MISPVKLVISGCIFAAVLAGCPFAPAYQIARHRFAAEEINKAQLVNWNYTIGLGEPANPAFDFEPVPLEHLDAQNKATTLIMAKQLYVQNVLALQRSLNDPKALFQSIQNTIPVQYRCTRDPVCTTADLKYRRMDGSCNNMNQPKMGAANTPYSFWIDPNFADGVYTMRRDSNNQVFPGARTIANNMLDHSVYENTESIPNIMCIFFGQFITHDFGRRQPIQFSAGGSGLSCCTKYNRGKLPDNMSYFGSLADMAPANDSFYKGLNAPCLSSIRSQTTLANDCSIHTLGFTNKVTHHLDLSTVYASDDATARSMRAGRNGLLDIVNNLAPRKPNCNEQCYFWGDFRGAGIAQLAIIHTIFGRLHNMFAMAICKANPYKCQNDEEVFQQSRSFTIALFQHITYTEWLPLIIGEEAATRRGVSCPPGQPWCRARYDPTIDCSVMSEFAHGAFRVYHCNVPAHTNEYDRNMRLVRSWRMDDTIAGMDMLEGAHFDNFVRGMVKDPMHVGACPSMVRNHLFNQGVPTKVGMDMPAVDIIRGRDHGHECYTKYLSKANGCSSQTYTWNDLRGSFANETLWRLQANYDTPDDIELTTGMYVEKKDKSFAGNLMKFLIEKQFYNAKHGDRFHYTNTNRPNAFTNAQLIEIGKYDMATLICMTTQVEWVYRRAFEVESATNPRVRCSSLPKINFNCFL